MRLSQGIVWSCPAGRYGSVLIIHMVIVVLMFCMANLFVKVALKGRSASGNAILTPTCTSLDTLLGFVYLVSDDCLDLASRSQVRQHVLCDDASEAWSEGEH